VNTTARYNWQLLIANAYADYLGKDFPAVVQASGAIFHCVQTAALVTCKNPRGVTLDYLPLAYIPQTTPTG
jgi:hypothetical protein